MKTNLKIDLLILAWLMTILLACGPAGAAAIQEGNEAFAQQDYASALGAYKTAMKDAPDTGEPFYNAANTHYRQQDYDLAELRARQSLQHADDELSEEAYFNLGNSLFQAQQYEAAIAAYEEVLWRNPQAEDAKQNLELAWQQLQQDQLQQDQQQDQQSEEGDQEEQQDQEEEQQEQQSQEGDQEESAEEEQESSSSEESDSEEAAEEEESDSEEAAGEEESPEQSEEEEAQPQPSEEGEEAGEEQPTTVQLTPAQAAQLLESAAREAETLQQYLQQQPTNNRAVEEDW